MMQQSAEVDVSELAAVFWDELVERMISTDPRCADLFDEMAGHQFDLKLTWNIEDGALTGTLRCHRCAAVAAWSLTSARNGVDSRQSQLSRNGIGDKHLDDRWKNLVCFQPPPDLDTEVGSDPSSDLE